MSFKLDLHVHTRFSGDNESDPEETVLCALKAGIAGLAFTEHYSYEASEHAVKLKEKYRDRILILRGVEFSSADGHCLIFGADTDKLPIKNEPIETVVRIAGENGAVVIPTHPYRGSNSIGEKIDRVKGFIAVEGHNGYSLYGQNVKAVEKALELKLPYTGGSDAHEARQVGACFTEFRDEVTHDNFLDLLRLGRYRGVDTRKISKLWAP